MPFDTGSLVAAMVGALAGAGVAVLAIRPWADRAHTFARLSRLEASVARLERQAVVPVHAPSPEPPAVTLTPVPSPSATALPTLIEIPNLAEAAPSRVAGTADPSLSQRFGPIWALADAGATADAIARAVGQPIGQVELILGLRAVPASPSREGQS